jgi:hypothetical protein
LNYGTAEAVPFLNDRVPTQDLDQLLTPGLNARLFSFHAMPIVHWMNHGFIQQLVLIVISFARLESVGYIIA